MAICKGCEELSVRVRALEIRMEALEAKPTKVGAIDPDKLYRPTEAAEILRCSRSNYYHLIRAGKLTVTKTGVSGFGTRIKGSDLEAFLVARRRDGIGY